MIMAPNLFWVLLSTEKLDFVAKFRFAYMFMFPQHLLYL